MVAIAGDHRTRPRDWCFSRPKRHIGGCLALLAKRYAGCFGLMARRIADYLALLPARAAKTLRDLLQLLVVEEVEERHGLS